MGNGLFELVVSETGLPTAPVRDELAELLEKQGFDAATMTLDQLRLVLADYLQDVFMEAKDQLANEDRQVV